MTSGTNGATVGPRPSIVFKSDSSPFNVALLRQEQCCRPTSRRLPFGIRGRREGEGAHEPARHSTSKQLDSLLGGIDSVFAAEVDMALSQGLQSGVVYQSSQPVYRADSRNRHNRGCRASVRAAPVTRAVVESHQVPLQVHLYTSGARPPI